MSFDIIAYGVPPSLAEIFQARDTPIADLPELTSPPIGLDRGLTEEKRRRKLHAKTLARQAEEAEAELLGKTVEQILLHSAPQYHLTRVVKRNGTGWHLWLAYRPNDSTEEVRDVHLDESLLGGKDSDRSRLDRLPYRLLENSILQALRQQGPMRSEG